MLSVSKRALATQPSPIRKLKPLADAAKKAGKTIYHLNIGQPDIPTPKEFYEGVKQAPAVLAYSPSQGMDEAVDAWVNYYKTLGISLKREEVITSTGGSEALIMTLLAICDPGEAVLVPEPYYTNYNMYARMAGIEIIPIETRAEEGFRLPTKRAIESKITPKTRAIMYCNPGNPTGVVYTVQEIEMLKQIALEKNLYLIADEVYREFTYDGLKPSSLLQLSGLDQHAICVDSISKRFSACGARVGAVVSHNAEVMQSVLKFAQARLSPPTLEQYGLINMLRSPNYPIFVKEMIAEFERRRNILHDEFSKTPGVLCHKPQGAFYVIAKLPVENAEEFVKWLLTDFDVNGETVMLAPAAEFYGTPGKGRDEVRIAYVLNTTALKKAMNILREGLAAYQKHGARETVHSS
jgi:aspartate aminotransferase